MPISFSLRKRDRKTHHVEANISHNSSICCWRLRLRQSAASDDCKIFSDWSSLFYSFCFLFRITVLLTRPRHSVKSQIMSLSARSIIKPLQLGHDDVDDILIPPLVSYSQLVLCEAYWKIFAFQHRNGIKGKERVWPNGVIPYVFKTAYRKYTVNSKYCIVHYSIRYTVFPWYMYCIPCTLCSWVYSIYQGYTVY